jgi:hypothetical protein
MTIQEIMDSDDLNIEQKIEALKKEFPTKVGLAIIAFHERKLWDAVLECEQTFVVNVMEALREED